MLTDKASAAGGQGVSPELHTEKMIHVRAEGLAQGHFRRQRCQAGGEQREFALVLKGAHTNSPANSFAETIRVAL